MPPRQPLAPPTFKQQHTRNRAAGRAKLASRAAAFTPEGAALAGADVAGRAARDAGRARLPTGNRQYQGVIVAEFLTAILIVALAPLARGKAAQDTGTGPSPYGVDDVKQLAGIGAIYFVLALLSSGKWGRLSAWLGGLILVAIGLGQTSSGGLPAIFGIFQPAGLSGGPAAGTLPPGKLDTTLPGDLPVPGQVAGPAGTQVALRRARRPIRHGGGRHDREQ
jgi:hypothetical protein